MFGRRLRRLCVFCGSSPGADAAYADAARGLGRLLAERGIGLVYGGASVGLMGAVAEAALAAGGEVIGVIPEGVLRREVAHEGLRDLRVVGSMHERKALMAELADGFIALPGGIGTLEEIFEMWTWAQLGMHGKPCALLDVAGYFAPLLDFLGHAAGERFLRQEHRAMLLVDDDPERLIGHMAQYEPPAVAKWIARGET